MKKKTMYSKKYVCFILKGSILYIINPIIFLD